MKAGKFPDGAHILRAKMSDDAMASPIMTNRDPALYRIRHARRQYPTVIAGISTRTTGRAVTPVAARP